MTPERFLSLSDIKVRCGITDSDLDGQLQSFRASAIAVVESRTRRHIVDAELTLRSPSAGLGRDFIEFYAYDIKPPTEAVNVRFRTPQDNPGFDRDGTATIAADKWEVLKDRARVYNAQGEGGNVLNWPERDKRVHFEATFDVGMADGKSPPEFVSAVLMLVREMQEGSAMDQLPPNIVDLILQDHAKPDLTATDELLLSAGVV